MSSVTSCDFSSNPISFLRTVFGKNWQGYHLVLFTRDGSRKRSLWLTEEELYADDTHGRISAFTAEKDAYFHTALHDLTLRERIWDDQRKNHGKVFDPSYVRGLSSTARAIPGFRIDIDISGPNHPGPGLCPDLASALSLVDERPWEPSITWFTGGGIQALWRFHDLWFLETEAERQRAAAMVSAFVCYLQQIGEAKGWRVDSVGDLSRVLRLPGTRNYKQEQSIPVEIVAERANLYAPADFRWCIDVAPRTVSIPSAPFTATSKIRPQLENKATKRGIPLSIVDGERHNVLCSIAGTLLNCGVRDEVLAHELVTIDRERGLPSVGEIEARTIARTMQAKHDRTPQTEAQRRKLENRARILEIVRCALSHPEEWKGVKGKTELAALMGALAVAYEKFTSSPAAAHRPIAEHGQIGLAASHPAVKRLIKKGWMRMVRSYHEWKAYLESTHAPAHEIDKASNKYRFLIPERCRTKRTVHPSRSSSLSLFFAQRLLLMCGTEVFRTRGLGACGLLMIAALMRERFESRRQLAFAVDVSADTAERKVEKMVSVQMVVETENGMELIDPLSWDLELIAKQLGTFGKSKREKERHRIQRNDYRERLRINVQKERERHTDMTPYRLCTDPEVALETASVGEKETLAISPALPQKPPQVVTIGGDVAWYLKYVASLEQSVIDGTSAVSAKDDTDEVHIIDIATPPSPVDVFEMRKRMVLDAFPGAYVVT